MKKTKKLAILKVKSINWNGKSDSDLIAYQSNVEINGVSCPKCILAIGIAGENGLYVKADELLTVNILYTPEYASKEFLRMIKDNSIDKKPNRNRLINPLLQEG
jgi:hypothetical protein